MEMVQFHPTGLIAGPETRITGTIIEEGLRGAGGYLLNGDHKRFMDQYDPRGERATRDIVSRGMYAQMRQGKTGPHGDLSKIGKAPGGEQVGRTGCISGVAV